RATSRDMNIDNLTVAASKKGIDVLGTGDFTHPGWLAEVKSKTEDDSSGLYTAKNGKVKFILTGEISAIYSDKGRLRKIHLLVFAPTIATAEAINKKLGRIGKIWSDGRPIFGMSAKNLTQIILETDEQCLIVPAHAWTPWFSIFGANSGYDSLQDCFEDLTPNIYAIETGLSSDPAMNWRLSALDDIILISNSDAHSPAKLAREVNVFDLDEISYEAIADIIKGKDKKNFLYTIEFFPHEGKYHFDGHRNCGIVWSPAETNKNKGICSKCKR
ncbi:unnamed protein product, partial [marine sediment metagenome]